ncbi:uncharacterized protein PG998_004340 [Apiospora kogelbergensis]|uniref:uncharacterized protein n=1 Tax=Apiospora kogelbergensis TaxID=1337665 RepID=UPI00312E4D2D
MASGMFKNVPTELLDGICSYLHSFDDRWQLSTVDTRFRQILVPGLYTTIRFSNRLDKQEIIAQVVEKYGHYALGLSLELDLSGLKNTPSSSESEYGYEDGDEGSDAGPRYKGWAGCGLPDPTRSLLAGLALPKVTSIVVRFTVGPDRVTGDWEPDGSKVGYARDDDLVQYEAEVRWRAVLAATWQALAENLGLRHLAIENLLPVSSTTWGRPSWAGLLGRLETLELGLGSNENEEVLEEDFWEDSEEVSEGFIMRFSRDFKTREGYWEFIEDLEVHFYRHAANLGRFVLTAHRDCPLGDTNDVPPLWASGPTDDLMPRLREARFENVLVCHDLALFIAARAGPAGTLARVELVDCAALVTGELDSEAEDIHETAFQDDTSWEDFFDWILGDLHDDDTDESDGDTLGFGLELVLVQSRPVRLTDEHRWEMSLAKKQRQRERAQRLRDEVRNQHQEWKRKIDEEEGENSYVSPFFNEAEFIFPYVGIDPEDHRPIEFGRLNLFRAEDQRDAIAYLGIRERTRVNRDAPQGAEGSRGRPDV